MSNFEVRDEEDTEVKQYAYDKNIVEVFVDKENNVTSMEVHIFKMMERVLEFLKKASLLVPHTSARFVNQMTIPNLQDEVRAKSAQGNFGQDMLATVFQRTSCLLSLLHAKKLLQVHGFESFNDYIT